jgi:hypothetical protein
MTFSTCREKSDLPTGNSVVLALNKVQLWLRNVTKVELQKWFEENQLLLSATVNINLRRRFHNLPNDAQPFRWAGFCGIDQ